MFELMTAHIDVYATGQRICTLVFDYFRGHVSSVNRPSAHAGAGCCFGMYSREFFAYAAGCSGDQSCLFHRNVWEIVL